MVFEEGLDISSLPETLKKDFNQLDRLEGEYRVTSMLVDVTDLEDLSPRKGPPCGWCSVREVVESMKKRFMEQYNPMIRLSKVTAFN